MTVLTKNKKQKQCGVCNSTFETFNSCQKYCKYECAKQALKNSNIQKTKKASERNKTKFSKKYGTTTGKMTLKCANCKKVYDRYQSQVKWRGSSYCSNTCKTEGRVKAKTKPQLVKKLDSVYSKYIRTKYSTNGFVACVSCGKSDTINNMQNGHYVSRSHYSTRWLDKNCHPQCYRCNIALHGNYASYTKFMIEKYGVEVIDELIKLSLVTPKYSKLELDELVCYYERKLNEYEGDNEF